MDFPSQKVKTSFLSFSHKKITETGLSQKNQVFVQERYHLQNMMMMKNHFQHWCTLTLFSIVSLISMTRMFREEYDNEMIMMMDADNKEDYSVKDWTREQRWIVCVSAVSVFMSVFASFFHVFNQNFAGSKMELGLVVMILGMWSAGLPTIMDTEHMFAVGLDGTGVHHMFFTSWGAIIVTLMLFMKHFRVLTKREEDKNVPHWFGLGMAGLVVLCVSARIYKNECVDNDEDDGSDFCRRDLFGLVLGGVTFIASAFMATIPMTVIMEQVGSLFFFISWCFGFAYLTFEEGTAATATGTIYFAVWAALFFAMNLFMPTLFEYFHPATDDTVVPESATNAAPKEGHHTDDPKMGGVEHEEVEAA